MVFNFINDVSNNAKIYNTPKALPWVRLHIMSYDGFWSMPDYRLWVDQGEKKKPHNFSFSL